MRRYPAIVEKVDVRDRHLKLRFVGEYSFNFTASRVRAADVALRRTAHDASGPLATRANLVLHAAAAAGDAAAAEASRLQVSRPPAEARSSGDSSSRRREPAKLAPSRKRHKAAS